MLAAVKYHLLAVAGPGAAPGVPQQRGVAVADL